MPRIEKARRPRALQACEICRARKNRCSEDQPCTYCIEHDLECVYSRAHRNRRTRSAKSVTTTSNRIQQECLPPTQPALGDNTLMSYQSTARSQDSTCDVVDAVPHTGSLEFYGASSSVAFLRRVESITNSPTTDTAGAAPVERSLASLLHHTDLKPSSAPSNSTHTAGSQAHAARFHFRVAQRFLDAYFSNIHYIQPLLDEESFRDRCEDLWFNDPGQQPRSFIALYYATLSLGSLVLAGEDWDKHDVNRFTWTRKLLTGALDLVNQLGSTTDVEMVQCYYMISKVYQHELNPHVAYLFSGRAARTALAIGLNRITSSQKASDLRASSRASMTWWTIYCQDIQTSFSLGRPDSLGPDDYHTQNLPTMLDPDEANIMPADRVQQIVPPMVELSRIMRRVGLRLYNLPFPVEERLRRVEALSNDLECWRDALPIHLQSVEQSSTERPLKPRRSPSYTQKQSIVLQLRYLNLRMISHGIFMGMSDTIPPDLSSSVRKSRLICLDSACSTIDLIYNIFTHYNFFRTWWYNTTYILFAVSLLLTAVFHKCTRASQAFDDILDHIDRAIAVLQAMEECSVTRNAIDIVKRTLSRAKAHHASSSDATRVQDAQQSIHEISQPGVVPPIIVTEAEVEGNTNSAVEDFAWLDANTALFGDQALFWTTWAQEIDGLGS